MELAETLMVRGDLFCLAGYPHPTNDWGWTTWQEQGEDLDDSDWNNPWNDTFWRRLVSLNPEQVNRTWDDVELEYDHCRILVQTPRGWSKESLPFTCDRIRVLRGLGVCALGGDGICVRRKNGWKGLECEDWFADVVSGLDGRLIAINSNVGFGFLTTADGDTRWQQVGHDCVGAETACATPHGVYAAGKGLYQLKGDSVITIAESSNNIRLSVTSDLDGTALAISADGTTWELNAKGAQQTQVPSRFYGANSPARFRGVNYGVCGKRIMRQQRNGTIELLASPIPFGDDKQSSWPRQGKASLRVSGGRLWAAYAHHLASTKDGVVWDSFRFR